MRTGLLLAVVAGAALLGATAPANAAPPPAPENLTVAGGEERWHADSGFRLDWSYPSNLGIGAISAVRYLARDAGGAIVVPQQQINWATSVIDPLTVPNNPGVYKAEVWLVNPQGEEGPRAAAELRFDNVQPAQLEALQIPAWLGRASFPYTVRFSYPRDRIPASGIAGYAVSLDSSPSGDPCAAPSRCIASELDLPEGLDRNAFAISLPRDTTTYLHAVAVSGSGMKSTLPIDATLRVDLDDPATRLLGAPSGWTNQPVTLEAIATDTGSGMEEIASAATPFTALRIDDGLPRVSPGPSTSATVIAEGAHTVAYYARDAAGNVNDGGTSNGMPNARPSTAIVRIDRHPPEISFANAQAPDAPELIRVELRDSLSGPAPSTGWVGVRAEASGDRFEPLSTEPTPSGFQARWDSEAYPPGRYEFMAVGYDAAGNAASTVRRANDSNMVLSNPLKEVTVLQAGFEVAGGRACGKARHRAGGCAKRAAGLANRLQMHASGGATRFGGRLSSDTGTALAGMEIRVTERFDGGPAPAERVTAVRTAADGTFSIQLAPGPSREVSAAFDGTPSLTRSAAVPAPLAVRSALTLRASSTRAKVGGAPLVFEGKVAAAREEIPADGKSVQLQFRLPGLPWTEFRTVQTDEKGRFRLAYRFSDDDSRGVTFQFRAFAAAQDDWPYEPGGSRPVVVRGV